MLNLQLGDEFKGSQMPGTVITLRRNDNKGAAQEALLPNFRYHISNSFGIKKFERCCVKYVANWGGKATALFVSHILALIVIISILN